MAPCPLELQNPRSLREVPKYRAPHDCSGPQKSKGRLQGLYFWSVALPKTLIPETLMGERCARHGCCCFVCLLTQWVLASRCCSSSQRASEGEREAMAITTATVVSAAITPPWCTSSSVAAISSTSSTQTLMPPRYSQNVVKQNSKWKPQADGYNVEFQVPWQLESLNELIRKL